MRCVAKEAGSSSAKAYLSVGKGLARCECAGIGEGGQRRIRGAKMASERGQAKAESRGKKESRENWL